MTCHFYRVKAHTLAHRLQPVHTDASIFMPCAVFMTAGQPSFKRFPHCVQFSLMVKAAIYFLSSSTQGLFVMTTLKASRAVSSLSTRVPFKSKGSTMRTCLTPIAQASAAISIASAISPLTVFPARVMLMAGHPCCGIIHDDHRTNRIIAHHVCKPSEA